MLTTEGVQTLTGSLLVDTLLGSRLVSCCFSIAACSIILEYHKKIKSDYWGMLVRVNRNVLYFSRRFL